MGHIQEEGRVLQVGEIGTIRIDLIQRDPRTGVSAARSREYLQAIAVRTKDGLCEADRFISAGPMKCRLEHDFFLGIALRLIESCRRLRLSKDVRDAVIADAVTGAE